MATQPMTPERWQRAQAQLDAVLEHPLEERLGAVARIVDPELRNEVRSLLRAIESQDTRFDSGCRIPAAAFDEQLPHEVGPYLLLRLLGEGGMGKVYLAQRRDAAHHKKVAIKLLRKDFARSEPERRFLSEREILADLEHPHIARLLDAGATEEGLPFLVMENVEGDPIDLYCDRHGATLDKRLSLFLKVCGAVQYAHGNLVVHRDLKPGNILVTESEEPKLLDFGIAKLLDPETSPVTVVQTRTGGGPLTPAYASPEQLTGRAITTASDVYSLGVLLYELLTGRRPYATRQANVDGLVQQISGRPPIRPSQAVLKETTDDRSQEPGPSAQDLADARGSEPERLRKQLRGDLDSIVLKALNASPEGRYASADQLAADLQRHLDGLPVQAREGTLAYRTAKFIHRHRWAVAAAAAVFILLLTFIGILLWQRQEVIAQSRRAETTAEYLSQLYYTIDPISGSAEELSAEDLLQRARRRIDQELEGLPRVRSNLLAVVGRAYYNLGDLERAEEITDIAMSTRLNVLASDHPEIAKGERLRCLILDGQGRAEEAVATCRRALDLTLRGALEVSPRQAAGPQQADMENMFWLGRALAATEGGDEEAERLFEEAIAMGRQLKDGNTLSLLLDARGRLEASQDRDHRAMDSFAEALEVIRRDLGDDHPREGIVLTHMGSLSLRLGNEEQALAYLDKAQRQHRRLFPSGHPQRAATLLAYGLELSRRRQHDEAEKAFRDALGTYFGQLGPSRSERVEVSDRFTALNRSFERLEEAEELAAEGLRIRRLRLGSDDTLSAASCSYLAGIYRDLRRYAEAETLYREALSIRRRTVGENNSLTALALSNYATFLGRLRRWEQALPLYRQALDILTAINGTESRSVCILTANLGRALHQLGQLDAAEAHYLEAIRTLTAVAGADHNALIVIKSRLGHLHLDRGQLGEGEAMARQALELASRDLPEGHRFVRAAQRLQGRLHLTKEEWRRAETILRPLFDTVRGSKGLQDNETQDLLELLIQLYRQTDREGRARELELLRSELE